VSTAAACRRCGTEPRAGARFCDACGLAIVEVDAPAEHKQVTVLFADVVRSMDLAAVLDVERLREVMSQLFNRCGAVVQRYGGTVDKFTGDGIMALFGAPIALEDHAVRACVAALEMQVQVQALAAEVVRRDGVTLALRVGLNSGQVVAGQLDSSTSAYTAVGAQVGLAQRMESVAEPGGVMLSDATATLVEHAAELGPHELVRIKGSAEPVSARRLRGMGARRSPRGRRESTLMGRDGELARAASIIEAAAAGRGAVIGVVGPPGIGKSRMCREVARVAEHVDAQVFSAAAESHTADVPFHVVAQLLRDALQFDDRDSAVARAELRARLGSEDAEDLALLEDLLGIRDPAVPVPKVSADARRRRLSALLKSLALSRAAPTVYVVEDAHWIDEASEAMLVDLIGVMPQSRSVVIVTYRPEYEGSLARIPGTHRLVLDALTESQAAAITAELLGDDLSLSELARRISEQSAGNPFYVQELIRELAERGVISGARGAYRLERDIDEVSVPPTLQATIGARIDRLTASAKRTLNAAAVIGSRVDTGLLVAVLGEGDDAGQDVLAELVHGELIDQVLFTPRAEYAFRHPLVRAVAYESQLRQHRAKLHRRLADVIEARNPSAAEENSPLIAAHLEAAGDLREAYGWHMRAGMWLGNRDIGAARGSWVRARSVADAMRSDEPQRDLLRAVPRALLCGSTWRAGGTVADTGFDQLRSLCTTSESRVPLVMGMAGLISQLSVHLELAQASALATEYLPLLDAIDEPALTVGLLYPVIHLRYEAGAMVDVAALAQRVVDLADGDPTAGNFLTGSPLAFALAMRASARAGLGQPGWREDFGAAAAMAHRVDPTTYVTIVMFKYVFGLLTRTLEADGEALPDTLEALETAQRCSEDFALHAAQLTRGLVLVNAPDGDRQAGAALLERARFAAADDRFVASAALVVDIQKARDELARGNADSAIILSRQTIERQSESGALLYRGASSEVLVEALTLRAGKNDPDGAAREVATLAALSAASGSALYEAPLQRIQALLGR
jgi:adenylate cyclase